jgi:protein-S-isoprenylcysteine O-methyltransferase Ste14
MAGGLPRTPSPPWLLACGDFFFRHRNTVFPLLLAGLCIVLPPRLAGGSLAPDRWLDLLGLAALLAGQALRAAVIGFAYIKRGGLNKRVHAATLVTGGLFGVCRNPIYLGNGLIIAGLLVVHGNPFACLLGLLLFGFAYASIVASEENFLVGKFGVAYLDYCRRVGRWWPDFAKFAEATQGMRFDWRRVVINDYGTVFAWVTGAALLFAYEGAYHEGLAGAEVRLLAAAGLILIMGALALAIRHLKKSGRLTPART